MFDTLHALLGFYGPDVRGVVGEHDSHMGNATATEMSNRGERAGHYGRASLPRQFDEPVWFDETRAVAPLGAERGRTGDVPDTYPFGL